MLYKNTKLNLGMKPTSPPVLCATRLLDQVRERIRYKHYSLNTEQAYVQWARMFVNGTIWGIHEIRGSRKSKVF